MLGDHPADEDIVAQTEVVRNSLPSWIISAVGLVELAENAERAATPTTPDTIERSKKLIVEVAEWQQKLGEWQSLDVSPRLRAELRILKATLDAAMDEANSAARELRLFE